MKKHILTDVDGVLVWWNKALHNHMERLGYKPHEGTDHHYNLVERYDVDDETLYSIVAEFNRSDAIADLEPIADSQRNVKILSEMGYRFTAITSLGDDPVSIKHRRKNLHKLFGDVFDDIIHLPLIAPKDDILKNWEGQGLPWVEDHFENALAGHKLGLRSMLVDLPYNQHSHHSSIERVICWNEIRNKLEPDD